MMGALIFVFTSVWPCPVFCGFPLTLFLFLGAVRQFFQGQYKMLLVKAFAFLVLPFTAYFSVQDQTIQIGEGHRIEIGFQQRNPADQTLQTTVIDPNHPEEPWIVTTYKREDESYPRFITRHKQVVDAVREVLTNGKS
jgi:hypothetical protein